MVDILGQAGSETLSRESGSAAAPAFLYRVSSGPLCVSLCGDWARDFGMPLSCHGTMLDAVFQYRHDAVLSCSPVF